MKYFKYPVTNEIYAYESDGSQDKLIPPNLIAITDAEADAIRNPPKSLAETQATAWASYQAQAIAALNKSDLTILRCTENAVAVPAAWATYRAALRAIISAATGDPTKPLLTRPAYPAGT